MTQVFWIFSTSLLAAECAPTYSILETYWNSTYFSDLHIVHSSWVKFTKEGSWSSMIFQLVNVCMWLFFLEYKKKLKYINILYISLYIYIYSYRDIEICIYILYMYICIIDVYVCELKYINILYISLCISTSTSISVEI